MATHAQHASLLILGAGQYGLVAREVALAMGAFSRIDFLDDASELAIGKLADWETCPHSHLFVAIGNADVRQQWVERIDAKPEVNLATLIHPRATIMPSATIGAGSIVEPGAVLCSHSTIGRSCIIMTHAVVGHDAAVGDFCQLKYNCSVPERCCVTPRTKVDCNEIYTDPAVIEARNRNSSKLKSVGQA